MCSQELEYELKYFNSAIMPLVEQVAPYIDKFENLKQFAEVGKINELTRNKEKIIKLGEFQKLQYERAEKLGMLKFEIFWKKNQNLKFNFQVKIPRSYWHIIMLLLIPSPEILLF